MHYVQIPDKYIFRFHYLSQTASRSHHEGHVEQQVLAPDRSVTLGSRAVERDTRQAEMSENLMRPKHIAKAVLRRVRTFINTHPKLRRCTLAAITRLGLYEVARTSYAWLTEASYRSNVRGPHNFVIKDIAHLTPPARRIYADLKAAIEKNRETR